MAERSSVFLVAGVVAALVAAMVSTGMLAACGQKGPLYLPDPPSEVVTRPAPPPPESPQAPNSSQTVDSPQAPPSPAPEVTAPEPARETDEDKTKKNGATAPKP